MIERTERTVIEYRCRCRFCTARGPRSYSEAGAIDQAECNGWDGPGCCEACSRRIGEEQSREFGGRSE